MDGKAFRTMAGNAVNTVATFIDEFPGMGVTLHITGKFPKPGTITIGLDYAGEEDDYLIKQSAETEGDPQ